MDNDGLNQTLVMVNSLAMDASALRSADTLQLDSLVTLVNQIWMEFGDINATVTSLQSKLSGLLSQTDLAVFNLTALLARVSIIRYQPCPTHISCTCITGNSCSGPCPEAAPRG